MKKRVFKISGILAAVMAIALCFSACSSVALLKHGHFSADYRRFLKNMQKTPPVSVEFEQYKKVEGFQKQKLITDTNAARLRDMVNALAAVNIKAEVESASNFAVRHYTFTDENGERFTFEFYGEYLKCEDRFYETENSLAFTSIRPEAVKEGKLLLALDGAHDGRGEEYGLMYIAAAELEADGESYRRGAVSEFTLSPQAEITAPQGAGATGKVKKIAAADFFADFEQLKGLENDRYIFDATVENGEIVSLRYHAALANQH